MMDFLAAMWADREADRLHRAELRKIAIELREAKTLAAPFIAKANARRIANMRQDGPHGFVMQMKCGQ